MPVAALQAMKYVSPRTRRISAETRMAVAERRQRAIARVRCAALSPTVPSASAAIARNRLRNVLNQGQAAAAPTASAPLTNDACRASALIDAGVSIGTHAERG